jgi:hypothetical protein
MHDDEHLLRNVRQVPSWDAQTAETLPHEIEMALIHLVERHRRAGVALVIMDGGRGEPISVTEIAIRVRLRAAPPPDCF